MIIGLGPRCEAGAGSAGQEQIDFAEMELFLKTAEVKAVTRGEVAGRNDPWVVLLSDGRTTRRGLFKYIDRPRPYALKASYKCEIAAYELDRLLGFSRVPPVVPRIVEDMQGALQIFLDGCINEGERRRKKMEPPDAKAFAEALDEINVFENLTDCERRDLKDVLIHIDNWKVCRVDFSEAFSASTELVKGQEIKRCSRTLYQALQKLEDSPLRQKMSPYLGEAEVEGLIGRKKSILDRIGRLISEKGEAAVLF